jgi:membrane-bound lytic murein transglycosylase D
MFGLVALVLIGCAGRVSYKSRSSPLSGNGLYGTKEKTELERSLGKDILQEKHLYQDKNSLFSGEMNKPSFFFLQPGSQTWKDYYYFSYLGKMILKDLPHVVPESEYDIPVVLNDKVWGFIEYFQTSGRGFFSRWLSRSGKYIPMMKEILESRGMPLDLVYLAMIESGFNVRAKSNKGAVGPWQFIESTAKRYGLRVDSWVDERMDPEKSTIAAANYLRDLYDMFQSWELAAAGYNAGEDRVQAAIERYKISDFWEISEYALPQETKDYVPKLMAALIIAKNPEKYGFTGIEYQEPKPFEKVKVPPQRSLRDIARVIGIDYRRLKDLNPSLIREATPPYGDSYEIKVPSEYAKVVAAKFDDISALQKVAIVDYSNSTTYRVRRGDSLGKIASRFGISVSSIKRANKIRGSTIRVGQVLTIPRRGSTGIYTAANSERTTVKKSDSTTYGVRQGDSLGKIASRYDVSVSSIKKTNKIKGSTIKVGQMLTIPGGNTVSKNSNDTARRVINYRVKKGDTLWDIASKYDVSVSDIKRWNNLKSSRLAAGDKIRIYE